MTAAQTDGAGISWLDVPAEAVQDERMQKLFGKARATLGFVPNVFLGYTIPVSYTHLDVYKRQIVN